MKAYKTDDAIIIETKEKTILIHFRWDEFINQENLFDLVSQQLAELPEIESGWREKYQVLTPIGTQEVWAAGVTYLRSRDARMEESKDVGGGSFYDRVYDAERPEIFFKATPHRCVGDGGMVRIRKDSSWNVPEPELTLVINKQGEIVGFTIGNDMSSRSIEGENPLYLPQAKTYDGSAAIGPCVYLAKEMLPKDTKIEMAIRRNKEVMYHDSIAIGQMKRSLTELAGYLFRECSFPSGAYLMTGTSLVPPNDFTLQSGDVVSITIAPIGTLQNTVA